ncbi:MAG: peroxiredoxin [Candidatus Magnetobacterium sp. LHC-1]|nr:peroxiredoxin [Nitrospirota bacterium]
MIEEGTKAPDFCLEGLDTDGQVREFCLGGLLEAGRMLILYFYPRDNTPGCTTEACDFRDNLNRWTGRCSVAGVSPDAIGSHRKFRDKHDLNFPLLSDPERNVLRMYDAWGEKVSYGKTSTGVIRTTCLITPDGIIKRLWRKVKVKGHVAEVLNAL